MYGQLRQCLTEFASDERGTITAFVTTIFLLMFVGVGLGVDFIRQETERAELQGALDRGVLAAASMTQAIDPQTVIETYMQSANLLGSYEVTIETSNGTLTRSVKARATTEIPTYFLKVIGVSSLDAVAVSAAAEGVENVEISLVLDISGSMASQRTAMTSENFSSMLSYLSYLQQNNHFGPDNMSWGQGTPSQSNVTRLDLMRVSASRFARDILGADTQASTSISLVPFAGYVNPGAVAFTHLVGAGLHEESHCPILNTNDFRNSGLPGQSTLNQLPHFQWFSTDTIADSQFLWGWCPTNGHEIAYLENDADALNDAIMALITHDGTGTQVGMKWGLSLLDPDTNTLVQQLHTAGDVAEEFADRPGEFRTNDTMKVIVLMTDGNTTAQMRPKDLNQGSTVDTAAMQTWYTQSLGEADAYIPGYNHSELVTTAADASDQLVQLCDIAKDEEVIVFTIGFDVAAGSQALTDLSACASDPAFFYDVNGGALIGAFEAIATTISKLRLVQ